MKYIQNLLIIFISITLMSVSYATKKPEPKLYFEPNVGQMHKSVKYVAPTKDYKIFLMNDEVRLSTSSKDGIHTISLKLDGANPNPAIKASSKRKGVSNYYRGNDPTKWRTGVPHFNQVSYMTVYPGIDFVFHNRNGNPEYDFVVAPGADPDKIRIKFEGAEKITVGEKGELLLKLKNDKLITMKAPFIYQDNKKKVIDGSYKLINKNTVAFNLGKYDKTKKLVIDPEIIFSTYVGGEWFDYLAQGRGSEPSGAYTICNNSDSTTLPGADSVQPPLPGGVVPDQLRDISRWDEDILCTRHDAQGQLLYATMFGGTATENVLDYSSDPQGNVHITGYVNSSDMPVLNPLQASKLGSIDGFIVSLNASGQLTFSTYIGGELAPGEDNQGFFDADRTHAVAPSPDGGILVGGAMSAVELLPGSGITVKRLTPADRSDPLAVFDNFVIKLRADNSVEYAYIFGGNGFEQVFALQESSDGLLYSNGLTRSGNFPTTPGAFQASDPDPSPAGDGFFTVIDTNTDSIKYSSYFGGSGFEWLWQGSKLDDDTGHYYMIGYTESHDLPISNNAYMSSFQGYGIGMIIIINPEGNSADDLIYSSYLGGSVFDYITNIALDRFGNVSVSGLTESPDFPVTSDAFQSSLAGVVDATLTVMNPSLAPNEQILYSTLLGGSDADPNKPPEFCPPPPIPCAENWADGHGIDAHGNIYVHGITDATNFPVTDGSNGTQPAFQPNLGGYQDAFLTKFHIWDEVSVSLQGSDNNPWIAIHSSDDLNALNDVDQASIRINGEPVDSDVKNNGSVKHKCHQQDANNDGKMDLVCRVKDLNLDDGAKVNVIARTVDGDLLMGQVIND